MAIPGTITVPVAGWVAKANVVVRFDNPEPEPGAG